VADDAGNGDSEVSHPLAYAETWDYTQTDFVLILFCTAGIAGIAILVGFIVIFAKRNGHPHAGQITTAALFWGLISAGSIVYTTITQLTWAKQNTLDLLSGYGDPNAVGPRLPWLAWSMLTAIYGGLLVWMVSTRR
jgi:hypothetical protein